MINIENNSVFAPNYKLGIEILVYLKNFVKNSELKNNQFYIFVDHKYIEYRNDYNQKIYYPKELDKEKISDFFLNNDENFVKNENKETKKKIQNINSLKKLQNESLKYKYLFVDQDLESVFEDDFGYIKCNKYSETKEGKRWFQIHSIRYSVSELEKLKALAIFKKNTKYNKEFFTYLETNFDQKTPKELYEMFFKELPVLNIIDLNSHFYDIFYIDIKLKDKMIFDKNIFYYLDDDAKAQSVYIGKQQDLLIQNQIIYNPKFLGGVEFFSPKIEVVHKSFSNNVINKIKLTLDSTIENNMMHKTIFSQNKLDLISIKDQYKIIFHFKNSKDDFFVNCDNYYDLINLYNNDLTKIYESYFNLYSNEGSFYKNYKKFLNELLYKICIKKEKVNFEDTFKIDNNFLKLLIKTDQILSVFEQFLAKKSIKNIKKDAFFNKIRWDFYSLESNIAIDIATSKDNLDKYYFKKNWCLAKEYYVITDQQEIFI